MYGVQNRGIYRLLMMLAVDTRDPDSWGALQAAVTHLTELRLGPFLAKEGSWFGRRIIKK